MPLIKVCLTDYGVPSKLFAISCFTLFLGVFHTLSCLYKDGERKKKVFFKRFIVISWKLNKPKAPGNKCAPVKCASEIIRKFKEVSSFCIWNTKWDFLWLNTQDRDRQNPSNGFIQYPVYEERRGKTKNPPHRFEYHRASITWLCHGRHWVTSARLDDSSVWRAVKPVVSWRKIPLEVVWGMKNLCWQPHSRNSDTETE